MHPGFHHPPEGLRRFGKRELLNHRKDPGHLAKSQSLLHPPPRRSFKRDSLSQKKGMGNLDHSPGKGDDRHLSPPVKPWQELRNKPAVWGRAKHKAGPAQAFKLRGGRFAAGVDDVMGPQAFGQGGLLPSPGQCDGPEPKVFGNLDRQMSEPAQTDDAHQVPPFAPLFFRAA